MYSKVTISSKLQGGDEDKEIETNRPLQGQSPYLINAGFQYNGEKGISLSLLYNVIGQRLSFVGNQSFGDIYEKSTVRGFHTSFTKDTLFKPIIRYGSKSTQLTNAIINYINFNKQQNKNGKRKVIFSTSNTPAEGEHKILRFLEENPHFKNINTLTKLFMIIS
jgi:hypothetical protein